MAEQNFDAWGRYRNPTTFAYTSIPANPDWLYRGYTGHEHLTQFALINMNGRIYDPVTARMLSPDNYVPDPFSTQGYNRYGYANNNPFLYTDPDGNFIWIVVFALIGAYTGGVLSNNGQLNPVHWDWKSADTYLGVGFGAIIGAVGGVAIEQGTIGLAIGITTPAAATFVTGSFSGDWNFQWSTAAGGGGSIGLGGSGGGSSGIDYSGIEAARGDAMNPDIYAFGLTAESQNDNELANGYYFTLTGNDNLMDVTARFDAVLTWTRAFFTQIGKEIDEAESLRVSHNPNPYYSTLGQKSAFFKSMVDYEAPFDIKNSYDPIIGFGVEFEKFKNAIAVSYRGVPYSIPDLGNINFGVAGKALGLSLSYIRMAAGWAQVSHWISSGFKKSKPDWTNWKNLFDQRRDSKMATKGYKMF